MGGDREAKRDRWRIWLLPLSILLGVAVVIFALSAWIDARNLPDPWTAFYLFFDPNPRSAANTLANAGEIVAAVLAIAITVVAIVVELAANRYTHRITELFVAEPINFAVMGFFVVTALQSLWVSLLFDFDGATTSGFVPHAGIVVSVSMLAFSLLILLPYFGFVFKFLNPIQVVARIRFHTLDAIAHRSRGSNARKQREAIRGIEQIADVGLNAMEHKDKGVSMASVDALYSMVEEYQGQRAELGDEWFRVEGDLAHNPDFVSMSPEVLEEVSRRRIWFEMKVLRQYQTIYNEALNRMRDVNYVIAINTRLIAESALRRQHHELLELTIKFFNTYLRATINARDVRTAYNVLNQFRVLAESTLKSDPERAGEIARYFRYYGLASFHAKLPFILETAAYDLCALNEAAFDQESRARDELLRIFLDVDKESESEIQETSLRGVRKAQVKLATYYLVKKNEELARRVFADMERERPERLASIRDELLAVKGQEFWEISDRGFNFDYLSPDRKAEMLRFFSWFGDSVVPARASRVEAAMLPEHAGQPVHDTRRLETTGQHVLLDGPGTGADPARRE